jgi:hypothetical protein
MYGSAGKSVNMHANNFKKVKTNILKIKLRVIMKRQLILFF